MKTRCKDCRRLTEHDKRSATVIPFIQPEPEPELELQPEPEMRVCSQCGPKPLSSFHHDKSKPDGYHTRCKDCRNAVSVRYRQKREERMHKVPVPTPHDEAIATAKDLLCEQFPTAYAKFVHSELLKRELVTATPQARHGWGTLT